MLPLGVAAPDFTLNDPAGSPMRLRDVVANGPLLLLFYPADFTPVCTKEVCMVRDRFAEVRAVSIQVLGVSPQAAASKSRFSSEHSLPFRLLSDPGSKVAALYGATSMFGLALPFGTRRVTYLVDAAGIVRDRVHSEFRLAPHEALIDRAVAAAKASPSHSTTP